MSHWESDTDTDLYATQNADLANKSGAVTHAETQLPPMQEVEGVAIHLVADSDTSATDKTLVRPLLPDQQDEVIVAHLDQRRFLADAGDTTTTKVSLLNNGDRLARFHLRVEGDIGEDWVRIEPGHTQLHPGARTSFTITFAPPRLSTSRAGERTIAILIQSPDYPGRHSRLHAELTVQPFHAFVMGAPRPQTVTTSWWSRDGQIVLPITNQSNEVSHFSLDGRDAEGLCRFAFLASGMGIPQLDNAQLTLGPGQTIYLPIQITSFARPVVGVRSTAVPWRIRANLLTQSHERTAANIPQSIQGMLRHKPLLGPAAMAAAAGASLLALLVVAVVGLITLLALYTSSGQDNVPAPPVAAPSVPAIIVQITQPVPGNGQNAPPIVDLTTPRQLPLTNAESGVGGAERLSARGSDGSAPLVLPNMVTAPNSDGYRDLPPIIPASPSRPAQGVVSAPTPIIVAADLALPTPTPAADGPMTYEQMFRAVGARYAIDWRILAAQAYLESSFDPRALGSRGDLGLMQVLPDTWKEWSPAVGASDPFDSYSNVLVAAAYLNHLRSVFSAAGFEDQRWMLVAYNWGPAKVQEFLGSGQSWEQLDEARQRYALDVLRIAESLPAP